MVVRFTGRFHFLSNFFVAPVVFDFRRWPTAEHAYQASKSEDSAERREMMSMETPGEAKKLGRRLSIREDWDSVRISVMSNVLRSKFFGNPDLAMALLKTGNEMLSYGNIHDDRFWGVCRGVGANELGKVLMAVRDQIRNVGSNDYVGRALCDDLKTSAQFRISDDENDLVRSLESRCVKSGHPSPGVLFRHALSQIISIDLAVVHALVRYCERGRPSSTGPEIVVASPEEVESEGRYVRAGKFLAL